MDYEKLRLLTQAMESENALCYKFSDRYAFCGWQGLPNQLLDKTNGKISPQTGLREHVCRMADGTIDFALPFLPQQLRTLAEKLEKEGILERCAYGTAAATYREYPSRHINIAKWAITGRCNMKCKHCFLSAPDAKFGELSNAQCKTIIREMAECGITRVALTGGEPLARADFFDLVDELTNNNISIVNIATNGLLVSERFIGELESRGLKPVIFMSFDGVGWHDWLRGLEGCEKQLMQRFELLGKHGFTTGSAMCVHALNKGVLRQSINQLADVGCRGVIVNKMTDFGEWEKYGKGRSITQQELFDAYIEYLPHFFEDGMRVELSLNRILQFHKNSYRYEITAYKPPCEGCGTQQVCGAAWANTFLTADGKLAPCISIAGMEKQADNFADVLQLGLREALNNSRYSALMGATLEQYHSHNPGCAACPYARYCQGGCRAQALEFDESDYLAPDKINCTFFRDGYTQRIIDRLAQTVPQAECTNLPPEMK